SMASASPTIASTGGPETSCPFRWSDPWPSPAGYERASSVSTEVLPTAPMYRSAATRPAASAARMAMPGSINTPSSSPSPTPLPEGATEHGRLRAILGRGTGGSVPVLCGAARRSPGLLGGGGPGLVRVAVRRRAVRPPQPGAVLLRRHADDAHGRSSGHHPARGSRGDGARADPDAGAVVSIGRADDCAPAALGGSAAAHRDPQPREPRFHAATDRDVGAAPTRVHPRMRERDTTIRRGRPDGVARHAAPGASDL